MSESKEAWQRCLPKCLAECAGPEQPQVTTDVPESAPARASLVDRLSSAFSSPSVPAPSGAIRIDGWLNKKSNGFHGVWQKRYIVFVAEPGANIGECYYYRAPATALRGQMSVTKVTKIEPFGLQFNGTSAKHGSFQVRAFSLAEYDTWCAALGPFLSTAAPVADTSYPKRPSLGLQRLSSSRLVSDEQPSNAEGSFFARVSVKWTLVADKAAGSGGDVPTALFLEASSAIIAVFDSLSGMGVVKSDMEGNVSKIRANLAGCRDGVTLREMIEKEMSGGRNGKSLSLDGKSTGCSLLWLKRALRFISGMLAAMAKHKDWAMRECVNAGYEGSLKVHHNFVMKNVFSVASRAAPARAAFFATLGDSEEALMPALVEMLGKFEGVLGGIHAMLVEKGIEVKG